MKFQKGDRVVHRSQRLDTLNTIEWVVYNAVPGGGYIQPRYYCRAVVRQISPTGVVGHYMVEGSFYECELKTATEEADATM